MFTKIQLALLSFFLIFAGFLAAFYVDAPALREQANRSAVSFEPVSGHFPAMQDNLDALSESYKAMKNTADAAHAQLSAVNTVLADLIGQAEAEKMQDEAQTKLIGQMVTESEKHAKQTNDVLDTILSKILGKPIGQTFGKKATIKVFSLKAAGYRGYMAKVKLHDPNAVKLVLSHDKVGDKGETTSRAASRVGAKLAINGGGFAKGEDGLLYPMGITVVDGEIVTFYRNDLSFIGFNDDGNLVGGDITQKEQIEEMRVMQGATFVPTLLKGGKKQTIPGKWRNKKEPRTLIGHFSNGDLLFIVIDGRQKGSAGVTLEEAQDKLLEFNVRDAYNLDGGGSSTFYYNGKVLNSPSDGRERLLASSFAIFP